MIVKKRKRTLQCVIQKDTLNCEWMYSLDSARNVVLWFPSRRLIEKPIIIIIMILIIILNIIHCAL